MAVRGCFWIVFAAVIILLSIILAATVFRPNSDWCELANNAGECKYYKNNKLCYCIDTFSTENTANESKELGLYERSDQQCNSLKGSLAVVDYDDLLTWLGKRMFKMGVNNALVGLRKMTSKWFWMEDEIATEAGDLVWKPEFSQEPKDTIGMITVETVKKIDEDYDFKQLYLNYDHYIEADRSYQWYGFRTSDNIFSIDKYFICKYDSESHLKIEESDGTDEDEEPLDQNDRCYCSSSEEIQLSTAGDSEIFQSPGYPQNYCSDSNCRWFVTIPEGYAIKLDWHVFSTEFNMDMVYVYDGETDDSPLLATCTGSMCTDQQSTGNKMQIHFRSDHVTTDLGFRAKVMGVQADPCLCSKSSSVTLPNLHDSQTLLSPQYPQPYCMMHQCGWTITAPSNLGLQIIWNKFDTETGKDFVLLYDGGNKDGVLLRQCSGTSCNGIVSPGNKVHVQFVSDGVTTQNLGFKATVSVVQNYCEKQEVQLYGVVSYSNIRNDENAVIGSNATLTCAENSRILGTSEQTTDSAMCESPNWNKGFGTCAPACHIEWRDTDDYTNIRYCKSNDPKHELKAYTSSGESLLFEQYDFVNQVALKEPDQLDCTEGLWMPLATPSIKCTNIDPKILLIGGLNDQSMELYYQNDPSRNRVLDWMMGDQRYSFDSVLTPDGSVMSVGGHNANSYLNTCERYIPKTDKLEICPDLTIARLHPAAALLDKTPCVCGGIKENCEYLESCECLKDNQWQAMTPMATKRSTFSLVAISGHLLAMGGATTDQLRLASVEKYDPQTEQWSFVEPMTTKRESHGAGVFEGKVVVCGGRDEFYANLYTCEEYDMQKNVWHYFPTMKEPRGFELNLISTGDALFAIGANEAGDSVEMFDTETEKWSLIGKTKQRLMFRAVLIP